jgi:hypothetical protein
MEKAGRERRAVRGGEEGGPFDELGLQFDQILEKSVRRSHPTAVDSKQLGHACCSHENTLSRQDQQTERFSRSNSVAPLRPLSPPL